MEQTVELGYKAALLVEAVKADTVSELPENMVVGPCPPDADLLPVEDAISEVSASSGTKTPRNQVTKKLKPKPSRYSNLQRLSLRSKLV